MSQVKIGSVAVVGRPNVGKSTLINNLVGQKIAAVSPKPQTTQQVIQSYYEDERGQIFFFDTPGLYQGQTQKHSENLTSLIKTADVILYVIDPHKEYGHEEQLIWNQVQSSRVPIVMVINKIDLGKPRYLNDYLSKTLSDIETSIEISALNTTHLESLKNILFDLLNYGQRNTTVDSMPVPILSHDSKEYLAEIIKEKIYLYTDDKVPYQTHVIVTSVKENDSQNSMTIKAHIHVTQERYKPMLIGSKGQMVKKIGQAVRQELELATNKHINLLLTVVSKQKN